MGPTDRIIVLIDMDCFYCQVEEKLNPKLKDKPIAVVQYNAWRGGGIIAVNYPARNEGVTRHMRGNDAKKKCPNIQLVQVPEVRGKADLTKYRDAGKEVADVLATFTPLLQRASVDEAYLDITELVEKRINSNLGVLTVDKLSNTFVVGSDLKDFLHNVTINKEFSTDNFKLAVGGLITEEIRHEVFQKTGYKCSAGIAHNKILAKLVCGLHKPNKQTILPQDGVVQFFETVPINKITSLGGKFGQTVSDDFQINFMGQLAKISEKELLQRYDEKTAHWLYNIARGVDNEPVTAKLISKSIACCKNFAGKSALSSPEDVNHWLNELAEEISERLKKDLKVNNRKAKQIVVSFTQKINKKDVSSSRTHPLVSYNAEKIAKGALDVINKFCLRSDGSYHLKFLGLSAGHFEDVKNVREITTFFQVGHPKKTEKNTRKDHCQLDTTMDNNDETCDPENPDFQNIYSQLTQELEEHVQDLIFYDDAYRVKNYVAQAQSIGSDHSEPEVFRSNEDLSVDLDSNKPASSFFSKYFDSDTHTDDNLVSHNVQINEPQSATETPSGLALGEFCDECQNMIPFTDLPFHQDYHLALKLSKSDSSSQIINDNKRIIHSEKKEEKLKGRKRKVNSGNNKTIAIFFKKDELDSTVETEICQECNKRIKIEEMGSHLDYHIAKKIHQEINKTQQSRTGGSTKLPQVKSNNCKKQTPNRSVMSFFKPL